jgi:hypothetical protein
MAEALKRLTDPSQLKVKDLNFGRSDARTEFLEDIRSQATYFRDAFFIPGNLDVQGLLDGKYHYVTGLKGCGKTALLRFMYLYHQQTRNDCSSFIVFKETFSERDRAQFETAARVTGLEGLSEVPDETDYKEGWYWVFFHQIADLLKKNPTFSMQNLVGDVDFVKFMASVFDAERPSVIRRIIDYFQSGSVKISGDAQIVAGELSVNFKKPNPVVVERHNLLDIAKHLLLRIQSKSPSRINVFVDEIDLSYGSKKAYRRDCRLVRDLILVINELNAAFVEVASPVQIICAVRSEVLNAVETTGREINKAITDYQLQIDWHSARVSDDNDLLKIVERKIAATEKGIFGKPMTQDVWSRYFARYVYDDDMKRYLLHQTWFKPRDLVRLLNTVKKQYPGSPRITGEMLWNVRREYAKTSWAEISEELYASYMPAQILAIRRVFQRVGGKPFNFDFFRAEVEGKSRLHPGVQRLFAERSPEVVLDDLFRIGMIGNVYRRSNREAAVNWAFRGGSDLMHDRSIIVHPALLPAFED